MNLQEIPEEAVRRKAPDILPIPGLPAACRIEGESCREGGPLLPPQLTPMAEGLCCLADRGIDRLEQTGDDNLSFSIRSRSAPTVSGRKTPSVGGSAAAGCKSVWPRCKKGSVLWAFPT